MPRHKIRLKFYSAQSSSYNNKRLLILIPHSFKKFQKKKRQSNNSKSTQLMRVFRRKIMVVTSEAAAIIYPITKQVKMSHSLGSWHRKTANLWTKCFSITIVLAIKQQKLPILNKMSRVVKGKFRGTRESHLNIMSRIWWKPRAHWFRLSLRI